MAIKFQEVPKSYLEGEGMYVLPPEITRRQAANLLGVTDRTLQRYLNMARLYIDEFEVFTHPLTGELNRHYKIHEWHLPFLWKIRARVNQVGITQTKIELSQGKI